MRKPRTMLGGRRFKIIRESDTLWRVPQKVSWDAEVHALKRGDDLLVSAEVYDAIEDAIRRAKGEKLP